MAVALKNIDKEAQKKNLRLVPDSKKTEKVEYEFPYNDMYLLYDYIMKDMEK